MIRFENAADATAPAQVVTVTQVLDEDLDPRTFRVDDFGFADFRSEQPANASFFQTRIDRTEEQGIFIDVSARIDTTTRTITWVFTSIDPETGEVPVDATKGFLQPNDETGRGDGFISYTIKARRTVETGTVIDAEARIVFDTQGPIDTPPIFNTLDAGKPSSAVQALPATSESTQFTVSWSGTDDEGGSSIRDYDVYVKTNDGAWTLWLFNTTDTEGVFEGEGGNSYAFYSVARDNAGNVEAAPAVADASTLVLGQTGSISGIVFNDIDADGTRDADEAGLAGWTVFLDGDADGVLDNTESSTVTDALGNWRFDGLQPGSYPVTLVKQADFDVTAPATGVHSVTLVGGDTADDRAFGVLPLGSISGTQFEDTDGDGVFDAGEQGVAGWTMFLDDDGDGQLDAGERSTVTAADGTYTFTGLRAGSYRVAQVIPEGWIQTLPGTASANTSVVTLSGSLASISLPACACGGTITTVAAQQAGWDEQLTELDSLRADPVFADLDGRGVRVVVIDTGIDRSHEFFDGRIVYQYDFADNDADATDVNGHGTHVAGVIGGEDALFGGVAPGVELIVLKVFGDDGSGSFRHLERALQWVVANADAYNIGVVNLSLGDGGNWGDAVSRYGLGDEFAALQAQSIISVAAAGNNYAQVNALGVAYPAADPAVLAVGAVWSGDFGGPWRFGNGGVDEATGADHIASFSQRDDELLDAFAPGARLTSAAIGGGVRSMQGTSQSAAYVSGVAALAQQAAREHLGRSLTVEEFRTLLVSTATWIHDGDDERDNVVNSELDFPRLDAKGLIQALMALAPANGGGTGGDGGGGTGDDGEPPALPSTDGGAIDVVLAVDEDRGDVNFGAFELASLGGTVFDDLDGDGVQDAGEAGIVGATVFVDLDGDGVLDAGEAGTTTGAGGAWSLTNLGPGTLTVAETLPAGWARTTVASHAVAITSGLVATGLDFGRRDIAPVAVDDTANVVEGQTVTGNVLDNDSDPGRVDNALLSVSLIEGPAMGSLILNADGSFSYTAAKPFTGVVSFRYLVSDGVSTDEGRADITVLPDGSFVPGTVSGKVFDDLDGDGVQDAGEAGIAGATVFLDADTDGVLDAGETSTTTSTGGAWSFGGLAAGTVTVADVLPAGWQRTTVASHAVVITSGVVATGLDFGRRDIAPVAVDDGASVVEGQTVTGNVLDNDSDPGRADNGLLSVSLLEGPATGSLTLNADGSFSYTAAKPFTGVVSFRYLVSDGVSTDEGQADITVLPDDSFVPGTVSGAVFDDLDGDGVQDAGEAGIAGATVFLDADTDGVLDAGETSTTTGAGGTWTFGGLAAGTVTVADVLPAGWQRTTVASHAVVITSGVVATGLDFGRRDIAPVAVDDGASVVEGQTVTGNVLDNDSDPGRADKALLTVSLIEGPATGSLTLNADGSFSYTAAAGFVGNASFRYAVSDGVSSDEGLVQITVLHDMLRVQQFSGRHDGFEVVFSRPFASAGLDVGGLSGDVVVTNEGGQVVPGSLFLAADGLSARFLATGAGLADGVYQVKLVSGAQAWRDLTGSTLDGNADGTPGDHWLGSFTVAKGGAVTVGLADVARGPGQALGLAPADTGLQLRLSNGSGVTAVSFVLAYDPALLGVATLQRGSGLPAGATFSATELTAGRISVQIASATALAAGSVNLAMLVATVPAGAAYGAAQVLDVQNLQVNAGAIAALDNDATHVAAFPGDLNGDRAHTNADLVLMDALLAGSLSRLDAYPRIDAALLGDANGSGSFDGIDSLRFGQALAGTGSAIVRLPGSPPPPPPVVTPPAPPVVKVPPVVKPITPPSSSWVTPLVSLSATVSANTSIRVTV
ncbi:Ig-like domain-containing protein [Aquabacterium sp. J223]|nr:Ig-like domain-containing protein [Aquabacterium sp. J223]